MSEGEKDMEPHPDLVAELAEWEELKVWGPYRIVYHAARQSLRLEKETPLYVDTLDRTRGYRAIRVYSVPDRFAADLYQEWGDTTN